VNELTAIPELKFSLDYITPLCQQRKFFKVKFESECC